VADSHYDLWERVGSEPAAEGATAPETLRQRDRNVVATLERRHRTIASPKGKIRVAPDQSLRFQDSGGTTRTRPLRNQHDRFNR